MSELDQVVFIVDDDEDIRTSLSRALEMRGYSTRVFASAQAFLDAYDADLMGCLILDYGMPQISGLELQSALVARGATLPIIFITGHGGVPESVQAMKLGAIDFLEKPFRQETLIKQIDAAFISDARSRQGHARARNARRMFESLTEREREIAQLLVSNPSSSSSKDVARHLEISPRTVDHHRSRVLEKMQVSSVAELVDLSISTGLFDKG
ncbi:Response regulator protein TodT [Roseobacter fucihabitans]|uniref:Response regulator protein TodT n=1 Tax=Roseobacter fucihabitans TaxID=1537242 RepID=A0ABZ2BR53_9RHOB|nr:response regulator [Roseobacter litoralis]MBC6965454.1 Response regulator protein TodT [Roseobacter litoralis]